MRNIEKLERIEVEYEKLLEADRRLAYRILVGFVVWLLSMAVGYIIIVTVIL